MHACDICQYLIHQNIFCTILPKFILANNLSYTVLNIGCMQVHMRILVACITSIHMLLAPIYAI